MKKLYWFIKGLFIQDNRPICKVYYVDFKRRNLTKVA